MKKTKNTTWSFRIDTKLKKELQKISKETGLSISAILNDELRKIVEAGEITFMTDKRRRELRRKGNQ